MKPLCKFLPKLHKFHISQMSESNFRNLFVEFESLSMRVGYFADSDNEQDDAPARQEMERDGFPGA